MERTPTATPAGLRGSPGERDAQRLPGDASGRAPVQVPVLAGEEPVLAAGTSEPAVCIASGRESGGGLGEGSPKEDRAVHARGRAVRQAPTTGAAGDRAAERRSTQRTKAVGPAPWTTQRRKGRGSGAPRGYIYVSDVATRALLDALVAAVPTLRDRRDHLHLLAHCLRSWPEGDGTCYAGGERDQAGAAGSSGGSRGGEERGVGSHAGVPLPYGLVAEVAGERRRGLQRNFQCGAYLREFTEAVREGSGGTIALDISEHVPRVKCRYVTRLCAPEHVWAAVWHDRKRAFRDPLVHIASGRTCGSRASRAADAERAAGLVASDGERGPDVQRRLHTYLHALPRRPFTALTRPDVLADVDRFIASHLEPGSAAYARYAVAAVRARPRPLYRTTANTVRLSPEGMGLACLPSAVRRHWTGALGWVELDLRSAQLAIVAALWGVRPLVDRLQDPDYSVWDDLLGYLGVSHEVLVGDPDAYRASKKALKVIVYGICFGMARSNLARFGRDEHAATHRAVMGRLSGRDPEGVGRELLRHPLLRALLEARSRQLHGLLDTGAASDCFGRVIPIVGETQAARKASARSALAQVAQAMEMELLAPAVEAAVVEAAKPRPLWRIVLWQHDGFSIWLKEARHKSAVVEKLQGLVSASAMAQGVPTRLEES